MARNLNRSKAGYRKRCFYYLPDYNDMKKLSQDPILQGIFYAKILSSNTAAAVMGQARRTEYIIQIETPDYANLGVDYFVVLDNETYRVVLIDDIILTAGRKNYVISMRRT